jgi:hypothetical protein
MLGLIVRKKRPLQPQEAFFTTTLKNRYSLLFFALTARPPTDIMILGL